MHFLTRTTMLGFLSSISKKMNRWTILRTNPPDGIHKTWLPVELLIRIISYIDDARDLTTLISVSRTFRSIAEPIFYRIIGTNGISQRSTYLPLPKLLALCETLNSPRIAEHIIVLGIQLNSWRYCSQCTQGYPRRLPRRSALLSGGVSQTCDCDTIDWKVGKAIIGLQHLQTLSFSCCLTHRDGDHKHSWIANLETRKLHELEFGCSNYRWTGEDFARLLAPCMNQLTAAKLDNIFSAPPAKSSYDTLLPTIETFAFYEHSSLHHWILSNRGIKNLIYIKPASPATPQPGQITHALASGLSQLQLFYAPDIHKWLPMENPFPYLGLQSVGSIHIESSTSESRIMEHLRALTFLKRLAHVELVVRDDELPEKWSSGFFVKTGVQHPSLRSIYVVLEMHRHFRSSSALIYKKISESEWKEERARSLTYWDIATGKEYIAD